ncbi:unnamed protein product [Cylicocyclus nassatus]|uniref:FBXO47 ARM repeats region domain-containing protein n=1 Tax=Cylicocyclus nassatus TaxID=53992 RepID=A0AA36H8D8_CYLNA|nr:unnamed protein product [Cylicocyclus nassatus]
MARHRTSPASSSNQHRTSGIIERVSPKITAFFPVHKHGHERTIDVIGKRLRSGVVLRDASVSPAMTVEKTFKCSRRSSAYGAAHASNSKAVAADVKCTSSGFGFFGKMPANLHWSVFDGIDVKCLCSLAMTSSALNSALLKYIDSRHFLHRIQRESKAFFMVEGDCKERFFTTEDPFYCYGTLLKSASVCFPTKKRITILMTFFRKALDYGIECRGLGRILHTMCSNWAFSECKKVIDAVLLSTKGRLEHILKKIENSRSIETLSEVITEFRGTFLPLLLSGRDAKYEGGDAEYAFWLSAVMRCSPKAEAQSKLLMMLFGPVTSHSGTINWRLFCDETIMTYNEAEKTIKPLSDALTVLMRTKQIAGFPNPWNQHDIFNIVEELSTTPEPWAFENFAFLLLFCPSLIPISLTARLENNYAGEACMMFHTFASMSQRWNSDICDVLRQPITQAMRSLGAERGRMFFNLICDSYAEQLKLFSQRGRGGADDLSAFISSHAAVRPILQLISESLW